MSARIWTAEKVESELRQYVSLAGRMVTSDDLIRVGRNDLATAIGKYGPRSWRGWADLIGVQRKYSTSEFGRSNEDDIERLLCSMGHGVQRQSVTAPFDLLVNGHCRIDVKAAHWKSYRAPTGGLISAGYFAHVQGRRNTCDMFVICCADGVQEGDVYFIPSADAQVRTITITPNGKYSRFRNNLDALMFAVLEESPHITAPAPSSQEPC